jgi:hypothetical protein
VLALATTFGVPPLGAQTVFQLEGGGNSVTGGYGGTLNFWGRDYEGWAGIGYANGLRAGAFAKWRFALRDSLRPDTLAVGLAQQRLELPIDGFGGGSYLLTQGAELRAALPTGRWSLFAGWTGTGLGAPFVSAARTESPLALLRGEHGLGRELLLRTTAVGARTQSLLQSVEWRPQRRAQQASLTTGFGANRAYGAAAWTWVGDRAALRLGFAQFAAGFRRADVPLPPLAEPYRENVHLTLRPLPWLSLAAGRQHFRQEADSAAPAIVSTLHQASVNLVRPSWSVGGGIFEAMQRGRHTPSTYANASRRFNRILSVGASAYATRDSARQWATSTSLDLREALTPSLSLVQLVSRSGRSTNVGLGGRYQLGLSSIAIDYQTLYVPFRQPDPFVRTLALAVQLHFGNYRTNIATRVEPNGRVTYTASGSTFLYLGEFATGTQPIVIRFERYVVRGVVRDTTGAPVEGAALDVGGEVALSNSRGEFFVRTRSTRAIPLTVLFDEFVVPGVFEVVSAPTQVTPTVEDRAETVVVILRRGRSRPPAPSTATPPPSAPPTSPPAP